MIRSVRQRRTPELKNLLILLRRLQRKNKWVQIGSPDIFQIEGTIFFYFDAMHSFFLGVSAPLLSRFPPDSCHSFQSKLSLLQALFFVPSETLLFSDIFFFSYPSIVLSNHNKC